MLTPSRKWVVSLLLVLCASIVAISAFSDRFTDERVEEWRQLLKSPISCPQVVYEGQGSSVDAKLVEETAVAARADDCTICSVAADLCESLGESKVLASQAYIGTGERIRRFLAKARTGDGFTIGVVGGSVSYGHGLYDADNRHSPKLVHRIIFDHLNALFPARGGVSMGTYEAGKNSFVNGALGATGSDYFSYCFGNHIPEETDLVLVEQGINDFMSKGSYETYELLLRGLLDMPNQPAILNLKVFALLFEHMGLGGEVHLGAAQFYDVPTVSLMNVLLHDILRNDSLVEEYFTWTPDGPDVRHIGPRGHKILGDLATAYIDTQLCEIKKRGQEGWTVADYHVKPMPRLRLMDHYVKDVVTPRLAPTCLSTNAKGKAHLEPLRSEGWREWAWKEKAMADQPGSTIEFGFSTAIGNVDLYFLRSKEFGLGNARCWVDDDRDKAVKLEGYWTLESNVGQRARIAEGLEVGKHTLHCELLDETKDPNGGKEFRIISLMSLFPGF